jgi:hypothetical protein
MLWLDVLVTSRLGHTIWLSKVVGDDTLRKLGLSVVDSSVGRALSFSHEGPRFKYR